MRTLCGGWTQSQRAGRQGFDNDTCLVGGARKVPASPLTPSRWIVPETENSNATDRSRVVRHSRSFRSLCGFSSRERNASRPTGCRAHRGGPQNFSGHRSALPRLPASLDRSSHPRGRAAIHLVCSVQTDGSWARRIRRFGRHGRSIPRSRRRWPGLWCRAVRIGLWLSRTGAAATRDNAMHSSSLFWAWRVVAKFFNGPLTFRRSVRI